MRIGGLGTVMEDGILTRLRRMTLSGEERGGSGGETRRAAPVDASLSGTQQRQEPICGSGAWGRTRRMLRRVAEGDNASVAEGDVPH